ncbi:hypothetical protein [Halorubrum sp. AJ67]|uniref:hypothetical protein n=1 Tax=Halorubrum sp. AJ67 TaxID=1173487 RepID=UPI0003DDB743|nr:hypothetical protein [Halorubrum sp. AJ67]CDK38137.1 hypothetical protein BN903_337 [Halorubrum sp. AJ67]
MGAYINFKLIDESQAEEANEWLKEQPEQQELIEIGRGQIHFWCEADRQHELAKEEHGVPDFHDIGEAQLKASGLGYHRSDRIKRLWVDLFEKLHNHDGFDVKLLSNSCGLSHHYFTHAELLTITDNKEALSDTGFEDFEEELAQAAA